MTASRRSGCTLDHTPCGHAAEVNLLVSAKFSGRYHCKTGMQVSALCFLWIVPGSLVDLAHYGSVPSSRPQGKPRALRYTPRPCRPLHRPTGCTDGPRPDADQYEVTDDIQPCS